MKNESDEGLLDRLARGLSSVPAKRLRVAYSGGPDSVALLHLLSRLPAARAMGLSAVHVDHRLQASSRDWVRHCRRFCEDHHIPLDVMTVDVGAHPGRGPEEAARRARYAALAERCREDTVIATAHHQEDLAETLLMRMLRGSGPSGLAGIPPLRRFGPGWLWRPLLDTPREVLRAYTVRHSLPHVEDPSNSDTRLDRGFLREEVMPVLRRRWPNPAAPLARAAAHQRETLSLLEPLAARDAETAVDAQGAFCIDATRDWSSARRAVALRCWLSECGLPLPDSGQLRRIQNEVMGAASDASPVLRWPGGEVRRFRRRLHARPPPPPFDSRHERPWADVATPLALGHGLLWAEPERGAGLCARRVSAGALLVRFRRGGERAHPVGRARSQTLKRLFQEWGIPPWERGRVPLLYAGGELAAVAGLWVCRGFEAAPDEPGWRIHWRPHAPATFREP